MEHKPVIKEGVQWSGAFTIRDALLLLTYIITGILFIANSNNRLDLNEAKIIEIRDDLKSGTKETQLFYQNMQNQVNATSTQVRLLDQRVSQIEEQIRDGRLKITN